MVKIFEDIKGKRGRDLVGDMGDGGNFLKEDDRDRSGPQN
jgi:hypothetical protein